MKRRNITAAEIAGDLQAALTQFAEIKIVEGA
jgi:hypothetical protein